MVIVDWLGFSKMDPCLTLPETSMILTAKKTNQSVLKTANFEKSLTESVKQRKLT